MSSEISINDVSTVIYRVASGVKWTVETQGILLMDNKGKIHSILYPQAALWDLISRRLSTERVLSSLKHIASLDTAGTNQLLVESLQEWAHLGLLTTNRR